MTKARLFVSFLFIGSFLCFVSSIYAQADFWQRTNGPFELTSGKTILSITSDSIDHMYISTFNPTKIYVSANEGEEWIESTAIGTEAYALTTNQSGDLFAATFQGVFKSTDHGVSWTQHTSGLATTELDHIVAVSNGEMLVGTWYGGIFRSTDQGEHWTQSGLSSAADIRGIFPGPGGLVFATILSYNDSSVYKSTDYGHTWDYWPKLPYGASSFAFDSFGRIYASAWHGPAWMSSDGGTSWDSIGIGLPSYVDESLICTAPNDDLFLFMSNYGLYRSTTRGQSWTRVEQRLAQNYSICGITWTPSKNLAVAADRPGIQRSVNLGTVWSVRNKGLGFSSVAALAADPTGVIYAGTHIGVLISSDRGNSWVYPDTGFAPFDGNGILFESSGNVIVAASGGLFKSTNHGQDWSVYQTYANCYSVAETHPHTLIATDWYYTVQPGDQYARIYRSTDEGTSWSMQFSGFNSPPIRCVRQIGSTIYAGCYRSTDEGLTWQGDFRDAWFSISAFVQDRLGDYLVAIRDSIYRSTNVGATWTPATSFGANVTSMAMDSAGNLYVGTNGRGLFASTDDGTTWQDRSSGLTDSVVQAIVYSADHHLWCGTASQGIFRSIDPVTTVQSKDGQCPTRYLLEQNFPNPFNPSTTIRFSIPRSGMVSLRVFDILGREVATLFSQSCEAGSYSVRWEAKYTSTGVYFYRLAAGDFISIRRMLFLK